MADAEGEELHDFAGEVLLRALAHVETSVEPDQHGRILRDCHEEIPEAAAQALFAKELDLALRAGQLAALEGHHLGRLQRADRTRDLGVGGGEVVVPEERHLLFERPLCVHHAEEPTLARVFDAGVGSEGSAGGDVDVVGLADLRIDVVGLAVHVEDVVERLERGHALERRHLGGAGTEARAPQQMFVGLVACHCHSTSAGRPAALVPGLTLS